MKSRQTVARQLRELRGILARTELDDLKRVKIRAAAEALRWTLNYQRQQWRSPAELLMPYKRRQRRHEASL